MEMFFSARLNLSFINGFIFGEKSSSGAFHLESHAHPHHALSTLTNCGVFYQNVQRVYQQ